MKVSELWLKTFIDTPLSISELGEQLTNAGIEVDGLDYPEGYKQGVLTLKIPANRGDCLHMEGVARELSLLLNKPYHQIKHTKILSNQTVETFPIKIANAELCPRYFARVIKNIKPDVASPVWLTEKLELAGIRSISAVVDILNYVMIELGQPLHAFDLTKLNSEIQVRNASIGESITLLDNRTVTLEPATLVIADKTAVQAIAGVMGGLNSSVTDTTEHLLIESAYFNPIAIRLASQRYGLRTDSSHRFERGIDPELQERALDRVTELLQEIVGGEAGVIFEQKNEAFLPKNPEITLRKSRILTLLGTCPADNILVDILQRANMSVRVMPEGFIVSAPGYRHDIALEVDLIEEIARVYGFEKFKAEKISAPIEFSSTPEAKLSLSKLKQTALERGYSEAITYSFVDPKMIEILEPLQKPHLLANPISGDMAAMRPNLWVGLLQAVQHNQRRQQMRVRLFELGKSFIEVAGQIEEHLVLAGVCAGPLYKEQWGIAARLHDFYDIKGDVEALLVGLDKNQPIQFESVEHPALHPGKAAKIWRDGKIIGFLGALHPRITKAIDVSDPIFVFELNLTDIDTKLPTFRDLSKFPAIRRDIAVVVPLEIFAEEIKSAIVKCVGPVLRDVILFDVYQGPGIEPGKKSIALGLILQHPSRTLVEEEISDKIKEVVLMLSKQFKAILRE